MPSRNLIIAVLGLCLWAAPATRAQSFNASINGTVTDPSGAAVPSAEVILTSVETGSVAKTTSGQDGLYAFPNLQRGGYELKASAAGFRTFVRKGILININESVRADIKLEVGTETQVIEVSADVSPINFENGELKGTVTPETIQDLPLIVSRAVRTATPFIILHPAVNTGNSAHPFNPPPTPPPPPVDKPPPPRP